MVVLEITFKRFSRSLIEAYNTVERPVKLNNKTRGLNKFFLFVQSFLVVAQSHCNSRIAGSLPYFSCKEMPDL